MPHTKLLNSAADEIGGAEDAASARVLYHLTRAGVPFLLGGSLALTRYTGLSRGTKDVDLFVDRAGLPLLLAELIASGFSAWVPYRHWLAKARSADLSLDIIFGSGNGMCLVDDEWFVHARETDVYGLPMKLVPPEELLWSKAFIMERERYDGGDIAHLLRAQGRTLDWDRLERRFGDHVPVLLSHVLLFYYIYSDAAEFLPPSVLPRLQAAAEAVRAKHPATRICRGTLLSRQQFLPDLDVLGYADARVTEHAMTPEEIDQWTAVIGHPEFDLPPEARR